MQNAKPRQIPCLFLLSVVETAVSKCVENSSSVVSIGMSRTTIVVCMPCLVCTENSEERGRGLSGRGVVLVWCNSCELYIDFYV